MCREVLVSEPFNFKPKSLERGKVWEAIAQRLNAIDQQKFRVSARAVRDRNSLLTAKQDQNYGTRRKRQEFMWKYQNWIVCWKKF